MAKIKLGNVKGPKGDAGVRGSRWYNTDKITGASTSGTAFPRSGIADAMAGDMALNPTTLNLYMCQAAGDAATAKWAYVSCIKGPQGAQGPKGEPTTVDAALSESSANPIQNKAVAAKFKDVQDSLGSAPAFVHGNTVVNTAGGLSADIMTLADLSSAVGFTVKRDSCAAMVSNGDTGASHAQLHSYVSANAVGVFSSIGGLVRVSYCIACWR